MRRQLHSRYYLKRTKAGFSMIEVLVASAILTIIVMMMGMLFQQTSLAWRTGTKRADAYIQVRSFVGALQRDAADAVDQYGLEMMRKKAGLEEEQEKLGRTQKFSRDSIGFFTLSGKNRSVNFITYKNDGTRIQEELDAKGKEWKPVSNYNVMTSIRGKISTDMPKPNITFVLSEDDEIKNPYHVQGSDSDNKCLPLYLKIQVSISPSGYATEIGAASAGPDKQWAPKRYKGRESDNIESWSKRN